MQFGPDAGDRKRPIESKPREFEADKSRNKVFSF
uniref:Succinate dehydrogenase assembly factor 4, mitochondrial n=1 Tax=Heterorhabditis bacteriophora TaxID=37862 RepID=A0A1I7XLA2_HETBA